MGGIVWWKALLIGIGLGLLRKVARRYFFGRAGGAHRKVPRNGVATAAGAKTGNVATDKA
jgi:hypothetical protein